jgi:hypothetical protein
MLWTEMVAAMAATVEESEEPAVVEVGVLRKADLGHQGYHLQ